METTKDITKMTNQELGDFTNELESKYQKLLKVANKLADEMDSLHIQYVSAKMELEKRKSVDNGK